jgi:hypothetical protein
VARYVFDVGNWDNCTWIVVGGASGDPASPLHWLGAVSGLILWTGYVLSDRRPLAQSALVLLGVVALLGITVVDRWHGSGRHAVQQGDGRGSLCGRQRSM